MRKLLVTLVVLAAVLVGLDFGGRYLAERALASAVSSQTGSGPGTHATIGGFSFLLQLVRGRYEAVDLTVPDVRAGPLPHVDGTLELTGVDLPLSDAVRRQFRDMTADHAAVELTVPAASLGAALGGRAVTLSPGRGDTIRIGTTVMVLNRPVQATVQATATVTGGVLHLAVTGVSAGGLSMPGQAAAVLARELNMSIPLAGLALPITSGSAAVRGGALVITAQARDIAVGSFAK